jgi:dihydrodipicolinate synthase/N-acetylneuraminate lyase
MEPVWRGIFPIVVTPFTPGYELDETSLQRLVRFCIEAGARGLVGPANASEFSTLSDEERKRWIEIVVSEAGGQVPVLASITCGHALPAVALGQHAQRVGASGVMSMPPHVIHPDADGCYQFFATLDAAIDIPIMVQNYLGPIGTPMSAELLARLCRDFSKVKFIKEETIPSPRMISQTIAAAGSYCKGVFGGQAGQYMLDEFRRGAVGNMPACQTTDLLQAVWNELEAGNQRGARHLFNRILPLINYERLHGVALYKELLYRRGAIACRAIRTPGKELDEQDRIELDAILADIEPLFTV